MLANPPWHQLRERAEKIPGNKKHVKEFSHRVIALRSSILYRSGAQSIILGEERDFHVARSSPFGLRTPLGLSRGQALARAYKTFASNISSGTIAARGLSTRQFRARFTLCVTKTSNS